MTRWSSEDTALRAQLKCERWPDADRHAWQRTHAKVHSPFRKDGGGPDRSPFTVRRVECSYGRFITYLTNAHPDLLNVSPCDRLSEEVLGGYFIHLRELGNADHTVINYFVGLRSAMTWMYPNRTFAFVTHPSGVSLTTCLAMARKPKFIPHTVVLLDTARQLFAEASGRCDLWRRAMVKDAVLIGLLATMVPRIGAVSQLELGPHVRLIDGEWFIEQTPDITKTGRRTQQSPEMPVEPEVATWLTRYVDVERVELARNSSRPSALLFLSKFGEPISRYNLSAIVGRRTQGALGTAVYPQTFRHAFATSEAQDGNAPPGDTTTMLGHTDPRMTLKHYNRATGIRATGRHAVRVKGMRKALEKMLKS